MDHQKDYKQKIYLCCPLILKELGYCAHFHQTLNEIQEKFGDEIVPNGDKVNGMEVMKAH